MALTLDGVRALDATDPLRSYQKEFDLPQGVIYLDGNSLGPPTRAALARLWQTAGDEWRCGLIRSWNDAGWIDLPIRAGAKVARLIGAAAEEVVVCDSVSVNLFKLATALIARAPGKSLVVEAAEFPTDQYVLEGVARVTGATLSRLAEDEPPPGDAGVVVKSLVNYKSAEIRDMAAHQRAAKAGGYDIIWDLSHATGLVAFNVKDAGAQFAVGCGYKFLNGGPGAPSFIHVSRDRSAQLAQPISGWMGHAAPFDFSSQYAPAPGIQRFAAGSPPILSLAALDAALDLFDDIDIRLVEQKARALGDLFIELTRGLGPAAMPSPTRRGGHVCLKSGDGYAIMQALIQRGVIGDFRAPDLMRFGFSPLFLSYEDVWLAAEIFADVLLTKEWRRPEFARRGKVT